MCSFGSVRLLCTFCKSVFSQTLSSFPAFVCVLFSRLLLVFLLSSSPPLLAWKFCHTPCFCLFKVFTLDDCLALRYLLNKQTYSLIFCLELDVLSYIFTLFFLEQDTQSWLLSREGDSRSPSSAPHVIPESPLCVCPVLCWKWNFVDFKIDLIWGLEFFLIWRVLQQPDLTSCACYSAVVPQPQARLL